MIVCPNCDGIHWKRGWSGRFSEDITLEWQEHVAQPTYLIGFENLDQYDTDSDPWQCRDCGQDAPDELLDALEAAS